MATVPLCVVIVWQQTRWASWLRRVQLSPASAHVGAYSGGGHSTPTMRTSPHHVSRATFQPTPTRTA
jgi:hypothetical protein